MGGKWVWRGGYEVCGGIVGVGGCRGGCRVCEGEVCGGVWGLCRGLGVVFLAGYVGGEFRGYIGGMGFVGGLWGGCGCGGTVGVDRTVWMGGICSGGVGPPPTPHMVHSLPPTTAGAIRTLRACYWHSPLTAWHGFGHMGPGATCVTWHEPGLAQPKGVHLRAGPGCSCCQPGPLALHSRAVYPQARPDPASKCPMCH